MEMYNINEAFKALEDVSLDELSEFDNQKLFSLNDEDDIESIETLLLSDEDIQEDPIEMITDIEADDEEELKDTYVGDVILQCNSCKEKIYRKEDDLVLADKENEEDEDVYNVDLECPHCHQYVGYELIGKVAPYNAEESEELKAEVNAEEGTGTDEEDIKVEDEVKDGDDEVKVEDEFKFEESLNESLTESDKPAAQSIEDAQKWVDYDMKHYGKISGRTNDLVKKAGFQIVKDDHGDYEVAVGKYESCKEECEEECKESCELKEEPIYDLNPQFDSRKSFYGKAKVDTGDKNDKNKLYSYNTLVAEIKDGKPVVYGTYSATTLRHIKDWLQQNGFRAVSAKQILADYGVKEESCKESCDKLESVNTNPDKVKVYFSTLDGGAIAENTYKYDEFINNTKDICDELLTMDKEPMDLSISVFDKDGYHLFDMSYDKEKGVANKINESCDKLEEKSEEIDRNGFASLIKYDDPVFANARYGVLNDGNFCYKFWAKDDEEAKKIFAERGTECNESCDKKECKEEKCEECDDKDIKVEEIDENLFNTLVNNYIKEVYDNVDSYVTTGGSVDNKSGQIVLEGKINFKSGKSQDTKFVFENAQMTKKGKIRFVGLNETFTKNKKAFAVQGILKDNNFLTESFTYNYSAKTDSKPKRLYGTFRNDLKEELKVIMSMSSYEPWSGAEETYRKIVDNGLWEEFENMLEDIYPDGITETQLNDLLWFDSDWCLEMVGLKDEEEVEESLDESKKGFKRKYKGCSIHDAGDQFVVTNEHGKTIGQSKTEVGCEAIIDDYLAKDESCKEEELKEDYQDFDKVWDDIREQIVEKVNEKFPDAIDKEDVEFDDSKAWSLFIRGSKLGLPVSKFGAYRNYEGGGVRGKIQNNGREKDGTVELGKLFEDKLREIENALNKGSEDEFDKPTGVLESVEKKHLNEGPGAGYTISSEFKINDVNNIKVTNVEKDEYGSADVTFTCDAKGTADVIAESAYYDGEVKNTPITMTSGIVHISDFDEQTVEQDIKDAIKQEFSASYIYGGGWSHSTFDGSLTDGEVDMSIYFNNYLLEADIHMDNEDAIKYLDRSVEGETLFDFYEVYFKGETDPATDPFETEEDAKAFAREHAGEVAKIIRITEREYVDGEVDWVDSETIWKDIDESLKESKLNERGLTKAERHNRMMDRISNNYNVLKQNQMDFLVQHGVSEEEVKELRKHTGLGKDALEDKMIELGIRKEFFDNGDIYKPNKYKESCEESLKESADVTDQVIVKLNEPGFISKKHDLEEKGYKLIGSGDGQMIYAKPKEIKEESLKEDIEVFSVRDEEGNNLGEFKYERDAIDKAEELDADYVEHEFIDDKTGECLYSETIWGEDFDDEIWNESLKEDINKVVINPDEEDEVRFEADDMDSVSVESKGNEINIHIHKEEDDFGDVEIENKEVIDVDEINDEPYISDVEDEIEAEFGKKEEPKPVEMIAPTESSDDEVVSDEEVNAEVEAEFGRKEEEK